MQELKVTQKKFKPSSITMYKVKKSMPQIVSINLLVTVFMVYLLNKFT